MGKAIGILVPSARRSPVPGTMPGRAAGLPALTAALAVVVTLALGVPSPASADASPPSRAPAATAPVVTPERLYNEGLRLGQAKDYQGAAKAFEEAVKLRDAFPEAWNGLGFALRNQGKYPEAVKAYDRALALRPNYAEALEYLGEAYVKMNRLDDARRVLGRLEPLDKEEAGKLRALIEGKK
jgi:Flp pilus assembly protein TadD